MTEEELAHFDSVMGDGLHEIFTGALSDIVLWVYIQLLE